MSPLLPNLMVLALMLALAVAWDLRYRRIPNALAVGLAAAGLLTQLQQGGPRGAGLALLAGLAVGFPLFALWTRGGLGGGDVKLAAAAGVWAGFDGLPTFLLAAALAGGVVSAFCYARSSANARSAIRANLLQAGLGAELPPVSLPERGANASLAPQDLLVGAPGRGRVSVPYAVAIALGTGVALVVGR